MNRDATPHVVVVGAGLAGLSCAIACADRGARVTVFEARPRIGGATWSFERNGLTFDNGQHVYLRCCTAYRRFLERIGTAELAPLQERLALPVLEPSANGGEARVGWLRSSGLPAPLHLLPSLLTYPFLSVAERMKIGRAVFALQRLDLSDPAIDDESFGDFLTRHGQGSRAISVLWDLITLPTVNVHAEESSLGLAAKVFKTGLLSDRSAADIGWSRVPLSKLHGVPAVAALKSAGSDVQERSRVTAVSFASESPSNNAGQRSVEGVVVDGEHVSADAVVLAVPHEQAAELLPRGGSVDPDALVLLGRSPIIDVHIVYDRKVMDFSVAAGINTPVQYIFDRTEASGLVSGDGQCLAISVSNADAEHGEQKDVLIERFTKAVEDLFPLARAARIVDAVVSREHAATFRGTPGSRRLRPKSTTGFANLFLAGSWLDTGWPATMEGAVRSGVAASSLALAPFDAMLKEVDVFPEEVMA